MLDMPFTPAHTAIILPFVRSKYFSATGLVVGSMAPDFEYFFRMQAKGIYGHTIAGLFYFDLPTTIIVAFVFHHVVKRNLIRNLPRALQRRFAQVRSLDFIAYFKRYPLVFGFSALLGSVSHLLWDSFTHNDGYLAGFYRGVFVPVMNIKYPLFFVLQHLSTIVGLLIVAMYITRLPVRHGDTEKPRYSYWVAFLVIAFCAAGIRYALHPSGMHPGNWIVTSISSCLIASVICGFINFDRLDSREHRKGN